MEHWILIQWESARQGSFCVSKVLGTASGKVLKEGVSLEISDSEWVGTARPSRDSEWKVEATERFEGRSALGQRTD